MLEQLKALLLNENTLALLVTGALGLLAKFVTAALRRRRLALVVYHAFHIVEDLDAEISGDTAADRAAAKAKLFLGKIDEYMRSNGWRELKAGEQQTALLQASAIHGAQKVSLRVAEMSAPLVLGGNSEPVGATDVGLVKDSRPS